MDKKVAVFCLGLVIGISFIGMIQNYMGLSFEYAVATWLVAIPIIALIYFKTPMFSKEG